MKKSLITLGLILTALFTFAFSVNAEEASPSPGIRNPKNNFETRFNQRSLALSQKREEAIAKGQEIQARQLDLVIRYYPEMLTDFEAAFARHSNLHEDLIAIHESLRTATLETTKQALEEERARLGDLRDAGVITNEDAKASFIAFAEAYQATNKASFEAIKESLSPINQAIKDLQDDRISLITDLKAAIEANDTEALQGIIVRNYDLLLDHIELDQQKLDLLSTF